MRFQGAVLVWTLAELLMAMSIIGNLVGLWLSRGPARDAPRRMPASQQRRPVLCTLLAFSVVLLAQATASAHFPWLVRSADNQAQMFFGEGLNDRTYQLPLSIAQAEILQIDAHGKSQKLKTTVVEQNDLVGLVSAEAVPADCILVANTTYGLFRGSKLQYTALSLGQLRSDTASYVLPKELALKATVIAASPGIDIAVTWEDKPLSGAKIQLCDADAKQTAEVETNEAGRATISDEQIHAGLNAIRIGHEVSREGKLGDASYASEMHYLTATFVHPKSARSTTLSALPFAITSFGAATDGQALYVFGGHRGDAHSYSYEEQSDKLLRLELQGNKPEWQEIAVGNRVQGTAMVAYGQELIVLGGFQARNKTGAEKDLHSLADVRAFHTETKPGRTYRLYLNLAPVTMRR